jgi:hypothetical protein
MGFFHLVKRRAGAFATLAAVGLLALTAALLAGAILGSRQLLFEQDRARKALDARSDVWQSAAILLAAIQDSWDADGQSLDNWWVEHSQAFPAGSDLYSLSSRVNLNTATPFLLKDSELSATLLGRSVEDFTGYRASKGPFAGIEEYKDYFQPAALSGLYCAQSFFNVNTADEIMVEKVLAARTGSDSFASTVRARLREFRSNRQVMAQSDLDTLLGGEKDRVGDLLTVSPELDVNTAPAVLLQALFRDPDWHLEQPDAKLQTVLSGRAVRPWNDDNLRQALGVDKNFPLLQYLGTRSRFVQGKIPGGASVLSFAATLGYSTDSPPKIAARILQTRWSTP